MSDPWDTMPEGLDGRVEAYLKKAAKLAITPDLVKKYALIVVAAEEVLLHRDEMLRATREEAIQVAALEHGIDEPDPKKARKGLFRGPAGASDDSHLREILCEERVEI